MKKPILVLLAILLVSVLVLVGCATTAPAPAPTPVPIQVPSPTLSPTQSPSVSPTTKPSPSPSSAAQKVWNLKLHHENPAQDALQIRVIEPWVQSVEKATNGRVKITIYPSSTIMKMQAAWEGVRSGIAEIAWLFTGLFPGQFDLLDVVTLPFMASNGVIGSRVAWALYQKFPEIQSQMAEAKVLSVFTSDPHYVVSNKKHFKSIDDFKGMKMRMTGGPPTDLMKLLGGVPMMISMPDVYLNLQKGVIDGSQCSSAAMISYRLFEVAPYITFAPLATVSFLLVMNKDVWNEMPPDIQQAIAGVSGESYAILNASEYFDRTTKELPDLIKKAGYSVNYYTVPPEEIAKWTEVVGKPVWDNWVKKMEGKGFKSASKILEDNISMVKQYSTK